MYFIFPVPLVFLVSLFLLYQYFRFAPTQPFPLQEELDFKLRQMAELEADLAGKEAGAGKGAEAPISPHPAPDAQAA